MADINTDETFKIELDVYEGKGDSEDGFKTSSSRNAIDIFDLNKRSLVIKQENDDSEELKVIEHYIEIKPKDDRSNLPEPIQLEVKIEGQGSEVHYWQRCNNQTSDAEINVQLQPTQEENPFLSETSSDMKLESTELSLLDPIETKIEVQATEVSNEINALFEDNSSDSDSSSVGWKSFFLDGLTVQSKGSLLEKLHICKICKVRFDTRFHLFKHKLTHVGGKPKTYDKVGKKVQLQVALNLLTKNHNTEQIYAIDVNQMKDTEIGGASSVGNSLTSDSCGDTSTSAVESKKRVQDDPLLHTHRKAKCKNAVERIVYSYKCEICEIAFHKESHLTKHMRNKHHRKSNIARVITNANSRPRSSSYICNCEEVCSCKTSMNKHLRNEDIGESNIARVISNANSRPNNSYICNNCEEVFSCKSSMKVHLRNEDIEESYIARVIVTAEHKRFYICNICEKVYRCKNSMTDHVTNEHTGKSNSAQVTVKAKNKGSYICIICRKVYRYKKAMTTHLKRHVEESNKPKKRTGVKTNRDRPAEDNSRVSGKGSKCEDKMTGQSKESSHGKPHKCAVCGVRFEKKFYLFKHMSIHEKNDLYTCDQCGKTFDNESNLNRHLEIHSIKNSYRGTVSAKGLTFKDRLTLQ